MNVTTKVSIVAGLVMAAVSPMSHALPVAVIKQQIDNLLAGDASQVAYAHKQIDGVTARVANHFSINDTNTYIETGYLTNPTYVKLMKDLAAELRKPVAMTALTPATLPPVTVNKEQTIGLSKGKKSVNTAPQQVAQVFAPTVTTAQPVDAAAPAYIAPVATKTPVAPVQAEPKPLYKVINPTPVAPIAPTKVAVKPAVAPGYVTIDTKTPPAGVFATGGAQYSADLAHTNTIENTTGAAARLNALKTAAAAKAAVYNYGSQDVQAHNDAVDYQNFNNKLASLAPIEHKRHVMQDQQAAQAVTDAARAANDRALSMANTIGGKATTKANNTVDNNPHSVNTGAVPQYSAPVQSMDHESRPNTGAQVPATVYNSQSQTANDHSMAIANIKGGKATAVIAPPAYSAPVPTAQPAAPAAVPAAPVKVAPQKLTQGGGVWAKAPDIQGTFSGSTVTVIQNQNAVPAPRPSTPLVVNADVIGQPASTHTIAKTITLSPGQAPGGVAPVVDDSMPVTVTHHDYSNKTPAAQPSVQDTPVSSTNTIVNKVEPAKTVDKWGVDHTVITSGGNNVANNATNAQDNGTNKASLPAGVSQIIPMTSLNASTPAAKPAATKPAALATAPAPTQTQLNAAQYAQYQQQTAAAWQAQQRLNSAYYDLSQAQQTEISNNSAAIAHNSSRLDKLEKQHDQDRKEIQDNRKRAAAGVAGVAAMANIPQVTDSQLIAIGAGVGTYDGQQALAVGLSARISQNVVTKATVSAGNFGGVSAGAGISVGW